MLKLQEMKSRDLLNFGQSNNIDINITSIKDHNKSMSNQSSLNYKRPIFVPCILLSNCMSVLPKKFRFSLNKRILKLPFSARFDYYAHCQMIGFK